MSILLLDIFLTYQNIENREFFSLESKERKVMVNYSLFTFLFLSPFSSEFLKARLYINII